MALISVVIPSYNCAPFLGHAIESVLGQSFGDFEIVVVDDGSTDNTRQVVSECTDSRVRYVYQENRGLPGARNRGVVEAQGEFIAALDADDALASTALEEMLGALEGSRASWCMIDIEKFWGDYREIRKTELPKEDVERGILRDDFIRRAMFFRKAALHRVGMWDEAMTAREDWELNIRLIASGEPYVYLERPLYCYRRRPDSITTGDPGKMLAFTEEIFKKHHKRLADGGDRVAAKIYAENMWGLGRRYFYEKRNLAKTARCVTESLKYDCNPERLAHPISHAMRRWLSWATARRV